jgi:hypothetical protein
MSPGRFSPSQTLNISYEVFMHFVLSYFLVFYNSKEPG